MGLKEETQGETTRIKEHLKGGMEAQNRRNFLKYVKVVLMKSPNNKGDRVPTVHVLLPNEVMSNGDWTTFN